MRTISLLALAAPLAAGTLSLDQADLSTMDSGWGRPQKNLSVTGKPLQIAGKAFANGVGTHAASTLWVRLDGKAAAFTAQVGVDDAAGNAKASIEFIVAGDGQELWRSGPCRWQGAAKPCRVDLQGVGLLELSVTHLDDGIDFDHADWADARIDYAGEVPRFGPPAAPPEEKVILTPPAERAPRIHGPRVTGLRPGSPFLFRIPCTGQRPITFSAVGLPAGITLDPATGILRGATKAAGPHSVTLTARNDHGESTRPLEIVVGDRLALTPPMGWNSWYIHYHRVTEDHMRKAAAAMVESGLADHGYQYVNIDDCWTKKKGDEPLRDPAGELLPNNKFPDLKGMVDYIHSLGLRAGTYTSPGPWTCAGYTAAYGHEAQDARRIASWGFDFLKYDWCSYGGVAGGASLGHLQKPYRLMAEELRKLDRDIVHNLCQYGMGDVWNWGAETGHCWRTTGDLGLERATTLPGFYQIGMSNARHWQQAGPGRWNDPDYLLIGWVGDAFGQSEGRPTPLTPNEQYSYMSMWALMAAPLIFSGDMAKLDPFTLNVLCNPEVIDVDQDSLGKQARIVRQNRMDFVLAKPLADGSLAVGLFNLAPFPRRMEVKWDDLGLAGPQEVRDLWRHQDLGAHEASWQAEVPRHGVSLVRLAR